MGLLDKLFEKEEFEIEEEKILLHGITHAPYGDHRFIVYLHENDAGQKIRVNTNYSEVRPGIYKCHKDYDGGLCNTHVELQEFSMERIERNAYNIWMSGAR